MQTHKRNVLNHLFESTHKETHAWSIYSSTWLAWDELDHFTLFYFHPALKHQLQNNVPITCMDHLTTVGACCLGLFLLLYNIYFIVGIAIFNATIWLSQLTFGYHCHMKGHSCHWSVSCLFFIYLLFFMLICCLSWKTSVYYAEIAKSQNHFWLSLLFVKHFKTTVFLDLVTLCVFPWMTKVQGSPKTLALVCLHMQICKCLRTIPIPRLSCYSALCVCLYAVCFYICACMHCALTENTPKPNQALLLATA